MVDVLKRITPGNYWLTKSMEFNKSTSSGSFWYLKKFIVYYYYVFLKENILKEDYENISRTFDNFIQSLPTEIQEQAEDYFYQVDIKKGPVITYQDFSNFTSASSLRELKQIRIEAKRYYFMYLMDSGGQSGWKKSIKDKILEGKNYLRVKNEINQEMQAEGLPQSIINQELSDFPASIRNERQIFFYYGFFHGKLTSNLDGFYKLTNIGKTILNGNFHEVVVIWEHQKLKMISQSPVSEIKNLKSTYDATFFSINFHPYYDLLRSLSLLGEFDIKTEYQYGISKSKSHLPIEEIIDYLHQSEENIDKLVEWTKKFGRVRETGNEDFRKEVLKYLLGISSLPFDKECNPYEIVDYPERGSLVKISNRLRFIHTLRIYSSIISYLDNEYKEKYIEFESYLQQKYKWLIDKQKGELESKAAIFSWHSYLISFDVNVIFALFYWAVSLLLENYDFSISHKSLQDSYKYFENVLKLSNVKKKEYVAKLESIQNDLQENLPFDIRENKESFLTEEDPELFTKVITFNQLEEISESRSNDEMYLNLDRKRNTRLIQYMKAYFVNNFSDNESKLVKCDCCNQYTFMSMRNSPYVEFHHLIPFSEALGPDHFLNIFCLCPNCHRKLHFSKEETKKLLYSSLSRNNNMQMVLGDRIENLYQKGLLEPIHLEFLFRESVMDKATYEGYMNKQSVIE